MMQPARMKQFVTCLLVLTISGAAPLGAAQLINPAFYPEGPLWVDDKLYYAEMGRDRVSVWDGESRSTFWRKSGCGPTAITEFGAGDFLVLCHLARKLVQVDRNGDVIREILQDASGREFQDPNDVTSDGKGGAFFSDPGVFLKGSPATGRVIHIDRTGSAVPLAVGLSYANGVHFDKNGSRLFVSEHLARRVLVYEFSERSLTIVQVAFDFSDAEPAKSAPYAEAGPDGLEFDKHGRLWVCEYGQGRILVIGRDGAYVGMMETDFRFITNLAFDDVGRIAITGAYSNSKSPFRGVVKILSEDDFPAHLSVQN
jgi:sugar lactone lactonase YvrE